MSNFVGDVNSSGCRSAEGSNRSSRQDCISLRASSTVGLSAALATESNVAHCLPAPFYKIYQNIFDAQVNDKYS